MSSSTNNALNSANRKVSKIHSEKMAEYVSQGMTRKEALAKLESEASKRTYAEAKKTDPKLDSYIKKRNALRDSGKKGTAEYRAVQNKINAAYGVSKRRREVDDMEKIAPKTVSSMRSSAPKAKSVSGKSKAASKPASKPASKSSSTTSKRKTGTASKDPSVSRALKDIGIEPSKEVKFDAPSKANAKTRMRSEDKVAKTKAKQEKRTAKLTERKKDKKPKEASDRQKRKAVRKETRQDIKQIRQEGRAERRAIRKGM